jgi:superfamily I DNA/RNA helicase
VDALKAVLIEYHKQDVRDLRERVVVLGRTFAQLATLEADMLRARLPYRVLGKKPFFERREVVTLLRYAALGLALDEPLTKATLANLRQVANVPRRLIPDRLLELIEQDPREDETLRDRLRWFITDVDSPAGSFEQEKLADLFSVLERLARKLPVASGGLDDTGVEDQLDSMLASEALQLVVEVAQLDKYYRSFYSGKLESEDRLANVQALIEYAATSNESIKGFLAHIAALDSTWGRPVAQQILMTTVFRTKGLEYDHVFIPECVEGMMPCTSVDDIAIFDRADLVPELAGSNAMENERRLFYVAITRAKLGVHIGTRELPSPSSSAGPTGPMPSRFLFEMRAQRTRKVVDQLQAPGAATTLGNDPGMLLTTVLEAPVMASALGNLARVYLPAIGAQVVADRLSGMAVPAEVMVYPRALAIGEGQNNGAERASASLPAKDDLPPLDFLD